MTEATASTTTPTTFQPSVMPSRMNPRRLRWASSGLFKFQAASVSPFSVFPGDGADRSGEAFDDGKPGRSSWPVRKRSKLCSLDRLSR